MGMWSQCFAAQENPISSVFRILIYLFAHIETEDLFSPQGGIFLKQARFDRGNVQKKCC